MQTASPISSAPALKQIAARKNALQAELFRREHSSSLLAFTQHTFPDYEANWHHIVVARELDRVLDGERRKVIFLQPPQTGKSELVSRRFPAYALGKRPNLRIAGASYNLDLAVDMSRDVQQIMGSAEYQTVFPGVRLGETRDQEVKTTKQFQIVGKKGRYHAVGVGAGLTGRTVDIGIIDDPVKNREEAESKTYRERVWSWYKSTFMTRQFGDTGSIIIALTRWHEDDLVGRLLRIEPDQWKVIKLEAIATNPDRSIDPREIGDPLWPSKYPLDELMRRKLVMGAYEWSALMQQAPTPPGGKLFKMAWFVNKFVDAAPAMARRVRGWDTAATQDDGDYTAGVRISEKDGIFYIEDARKGQWSPAEVDGNILVAAELDGKDIPIREEKEPGSSGKTVIEARKKSLVGYDYDGVQIDKNKVTRARPFRAQCEAGNVRIVRGPWNTDYLNELCDFPTGVYDDYVDASTCAFNAVLLEEEPVEAAGALW